MTQEPNSKESFTKAHFDFNNLPYLTNPYSRYLIDDGIPNYDDILPCIKATQTSSPERLNFI